VPRLRRSPFFSDARAGDQRYLSQVRPRVYHKDGHRNRARVRRREEAERPPRGSQKLKSDHGFVDYRTYQAAGGMPWLRDKCAAIRRRRSRRLSGIRRKRAAQLSRRSLWHGSKSSPDRTHSARRTNRTTSARELGGNFHDLVENRLELALFWQIYPRRCSLQIHFRQCGHRRGASRAMSSSMYNFSKCLRPVTAAKSRQPNRRQPCVLFVRCWRHMPYSAPELSGISLVSLMRREYVS
jgi:hypothetical protein